ncbi:Transposon Tf2-11 polyprotein [Nosema granulosis]|uniref:Transposon Tf2-11 polyprotein n=1 Tax=Nosema granulosis TaxID=83296 RepID=A0A9P6GYP8_9MICR|nr:Transposon Tf2-11 polyprotein [Nosema granulosis]
MKPNEIKKNVALQFIRLKCVSELRRFLGLTVWFRDFIPGYAKRTIALTEALKKSLKFTWTEEMGIEFEDVKEALRSMNSLKLPDYTKLFRLRTDACDTGIGAILLQENIEGKWVPPIQWASKKLTPTERSYTISEKEMLASFLWNKKV